MSEHSPLPWRDFIWEGLEGLPRVLDANGQVVATVRHKEDVAPIIKAVNNHDKLVEALDAAWLQLGSLRYIATDKLDMPKVEAAIRETFDKLDELKAVLKDDAE